MCRCGVGVLKGIDVLMGSIIFNLSTEEFVDRVIILICKCRWDIGLLTGLHQIC